VKGIPDVFADLVIIVTRNFRVITEHQVFEMIGNRNLLGGNGQVEKHTADA
jgi:hypothetical protein